MCTDGWLVGDSCIQHNAAQSNWVRNLPRILCPYWLGAVSESKASALGPAKRR